MIPSKHPLHRLWAAELTQCSIAHAGWPELVFCSHSRGQWPPSLSAWNTPIPNGSFHPQDNLSKRILFPSQSRKPQICPELLWTPSEFKCSQTLLQHAPPSVFQTQQVCLEHFLWLQRRNAKNIAHTQAAGWGWCVATAPTSAVKCFHPQVPTVFLTKPRGWWEGNALFCVAGNNRGKSSAMQNFRFEGALKITPIQKRLKLPTPSRLSCRQLRPVETWGGEG